MVRGVDEVFRALADPTRRSLLDELFREDGQTLSALEARFDITRFGVMKHLKVLEEAGLVVTRRRGREKLHFEMTAAKAGAILGEGEILEVDPPRRLVHTMVAYFSDEAKAEGTSRVTWEIEPVGDSCHLTLTHDQLREGANAQLYGGWPMVLSGLKTWLESGALLTTPGSLMWA
jgi:DNA-binding transcriptional ArsR family regulator